MADNGYLYVIKNNSYCKIGYTANPEQRIKNLVSKYNLFYPEIFVSEYHGVARIFESVIHYKFIESLVGEEWFKVDFDLAISEIERLIGFGFSDNDDTMVKKPRITVTPKTLKLINELSAKIGTPIQGVSNKIQIIAELIIKAHKKECKK